MEFIRTLREKSQTKRQHDIQLMSEEYITLSDFADSLYIAYQGTPLNPIQNDWTTKEIMEELSRIRQNFVNSKLQQLC